MYALCDANNFYASAERIMRPDLRKRGVLVLGNNEGCIVARSAEVKALGIKMGQPWFQVKDMARQHGIVAFASNYALYADISDRIVTVLRDMAPCVEPYSIDESFCLLGGVAEPERLCREMKQRIERWVGVPVCLGLGRSRSRSKLANFIAKRNAEFEGVFNIDALQPHEELARLSNIEVGEVWGVGSRYAKRLGELGILSVADLQAADVEFIRQQFGVVLARTVQELRGIPCIGIEAQIPHKQQIMCSRSFGRPVLTLEELEQAVVTYSARAAEKLREDGSVAQGVMVFAYTSPFRDIPQYSGSRVIPLVTASQDTRLITAAAVAGVRHLYRPGFQYAKAGVMLLDLLPQEIVQGDLFAAGDSKRSRSLMATVDRLNKEMGRGTVIFAGQGIRPRWAMKQGMKSPAYTTSWKELRIVRA